MPALCRFEHEPEPRQGIDHVASLLEGEAGPEWMRRVEGEEAVLGGRRDDGVE